MICDLDQCVIFIAYRDIESIEEAVRAARQEVRWIGRMKLEL